MIKNNFFLFQVATWAKFHREHRLSVEYVTQMTKPKGKVSLYIFEIFNIVCSK